MRKGVKPKPSKLIYIIIKYNYINKIHFNKFFTFYVMKLYLIFYPTIYYIFHTDCKILCLIID